MQTLCKMILKLKRILLFQFLHISFKFQACYQLYPSKKKYANNRIYPSDISSFPLNDNHSLLAQASSIDNQQKLGETSRNNKKKNIGKKPKIIDPR